MAKLETLEAKMANIEASLAAVQISKRRPKDPESLPRSAKEFLREIDALRQNVREKECLISKMKSQIIQLCGQIPSLCSLTMNEADRARILERLDKLQKDMESRKSVLKSLKMAMEASDLSDSIDAKIRLAELESQFEREELNILNLMEESILLQERLEFGSEPPRDAQDAAIFSNLPGNMQTTLVPLVLELNPKCPQFIAGERDGDRGVIVDWAEEPSGLKKGDRFVEVNGTIVFHHSKTDFLRILSSAPRPLKMVVMRTQPQLPVRRSHSKEVQNLREELAVVVGKVEYKTAENQELAAAMDRLKRDRENLRGDNIRLTHRISYLEEQVVDLHRRITSCPPEETYQVFQKGPETVPISSDGYVYLEPPRAKFHALLTGSVRRSSKMGKRVDSVGNLSSLSAPTSRYKHRAPPPRLTDLPRTTSVQSVDGTLRKRSHKGRSPLRTWPSVDMEDKPVPKKKSESSFMNRLTQMRHKGSATKS